MEHRYRILHFCCAILLVLTVAPAAPGQTVTEFFAPATVQADGSGHFDFDVGIAVGADDCAGLGSFEAENVENTDVSVHGDTFCINTEIIPAGTVITFRVAGRLVDPGLGGMVWARQGCCNFGVEGAGTMVLAPTVPADGTTWSTLKAHYR